MKRNGQTMKNLLNASQIRATDAYTIKHEPIASIDLMERAAGAFYRELKLNNENRVLVCCGTGNNGGDGLAIARILHGDGYAVEVWIFRYNAQETPDFTINYQRLEELSVPIKNFSEGDPLPLVKVDLVIDALLGSGLNKPLKGAWQAIVEFINQWNVRVVSVDIPTGLPADGDFSIMSSCIVADEVITFQRPKISFLFPESAPYIKRFVVTDIGLNEAFIDSQQTDFLEVTASDIRSMLKPRANFSHKGTYGHSLLVAGSEHTMGAALLCAEACLYGGSGLTTVSIPSSGLVALNSRLPEVMAVDRRTLH